jgi:hypothetical protein
MMSKPHERTTRSTARPMSDTRRPGRAASHPAANAAFAQAWSLLAAGGRRRHDDRRGRIGNIAVQFGGHIQLHHIATATTRAPGKPCTISSLTLMIGGGAVVDQLGRRSRTVPTIPIGQSHPTRRW